MPDPNKIEGGRWDRFLRSKFNLKGYGSTAARIADDISPVISFPFRLEDDYLIEERISVAPGSSGPTVAENPRIILTNDGGDSLLIIERIVYDTSGGGSPYWGFSSAIQPFIADFSVFAREGRWGPMQTNVGAGTARLQLNSLVGAPTPLIQKLGVNVTDRDSVVGVVLGPNDHFFITNATTNSFIRATIYWREHFMEPAERA